MKYMGSKNRFASELLPIILNDRTNNQYYVEPFAGGMNVIDKVSGNRIANDNNKYLIAMWKGLKQNRPRPHEISKQLYDDVRDCYNGKNSKYDDFMIGWVGFMGSANGRFFDGGYSGKSHTKTGKIRDYIAESIRNIEKQIPKLTGVEFVCGDYREMNIPEHSIIYCDIPYKNTKQYSTSRNFNHSVFWDWCRAMTISGHRIFVSEYTVPDDFICAWEKTTKSSLRANGKISGNKLSVERLFIHKSMKNK